VKGYKLATTNSKMTTTNGGNGSSGFNVDGTKMGDAALLPQAKGMLQGLFKAYGLQFPEINMADPKLKDNVSLQHYSTFMLCITCAVADVQLAISPARCHSFGVLIP